MKHYIMHTINWIVLKVSAGAAWELRTALIYIWQSIPWKHPEKRLTIYCSQACYKVF